MKDLRDALWDLRGIIVAFVLIVFAMVVIAGCSRPDCGGKDDDYQVPVKEYAKLRFKKENKDKPRTVYLEFIDFDGRRYVYESSLIREFFLVNPGDVCQVEYIRHPDNGRRLVTRFKKVEDEM
jgi:hypothetical protein